jgi:hypothetical protein
LISCADAQVIIIIIIVALTSNPAICSWSALSAEISLAELDQVADCYSASNNFHAPVIRV